MCTVSYISTNDKVIITSNRDEKVLRGGAIEPRNYLVKNKSIIFPKDSQAGGTWFAVDEKGTIAVLLNGANEKHQVQPSYRKSRGLIVLEIISSQSPKIFWQKINLDKIEPFTLILFQDGALFQLRWNGKAKETTILDETKNHIWSSVTLYPTAIREQRCNWFHIFLSQKPVVSEKEMYHFHRYTEEENQENGLVINRNEEMKTLSITQSVIEKNKVSILYYDLVDQKEVENSFIII